MTIITRDLLKTLRIDINAALVEVAKKHKLAIGAGNASFTASSATFKLNLVNLTGDADTVSSCDVRHIKAEHDFKAQAVFYGLQASDLSRSFEYFGSTYVVKGLLPRGQKYPILCEKNGKLIKCPADLVLKGLKA